MNDGTLPIHQAAQTGNLGLLRCLQDFGNDINQANDDGRTSLCIAAEYIHLAAVRSLAKKLGADVNQANAEGATPM
jgi:ankyrin repeat protein